MTREEKKAEEALKALLKLPSNKRCVNCDSLGPQYVVSGFNVFVCTVCSGIHRQFGHRVKGVSMSTFKAEEVAVLKESGNEKFAAFFLNKWTSAALPKPVDREAPRIQAWIAAVYQDRRFFAEPAAWVPSGAGTGGSTSRAGSTAASEVGEPAVRPMADVLGSDTPKLQVSHSGASRLERSVSAASSSAGAAAPAVPSPSSATPAASRQLNLLDVPSPKSAQSAPPPAAPGAAWEAFGATAPPAAEQHTPAAAQPSPAPAAAAGWASFDDAPPLAAAQSAAAAHAVPAPVAPAAEGTSAGSGWEAFGDGPAAPTAEPAVPGPKAAPGSASGTAAAAPAAGPTAAASAGSSPGKTQQQPQQQPARSASRPEVPMDVFFPEFEQIRATGILPTGQPVPLPAFAPSYGGVAPRPPANPYSAYGYHAAQQQQQQRPAGYGAPPRPTVAIPPAPQLPGGYHGGVSPAGLYPGMPSPGPGAYSSPSAYSAAGSAPSPAGSMFSGASQPGVAAANGFDLRSSTGSLGDLMPGSAAPTPAGTATAPHDPFEGLAPGLRSALPAVPSSSGKWAAPPPTPAGVPPYTNGTAALPAGFPPAGPFAAAPLPSPAGLAPATAAATATLFGTAPSLTGYDLSAPAAPKPQATGNPFA